MSGEFSASGPVRPRAPAGCWPGPEAQLDKREAAIKAQARLEYAARVMVDLVRAGEAGEGRTARTGTLVVEVELEGGAAEDWEIVIRRRRPGHSTGHHKRKRSGVGS